MSLIESVARPEETLGGNVTPQLAECFDQALELIHTGRARVRRRQTE